MASIKDKLAQASQNLKDRNQASGFKPSTPAWVPNTSSSSSSSSSGSSTNNALNSAFGALGGGANNSGGYNSSSSHNYSPGTLANNTAGFNGTNWNDNSGVLINGKQVNHSQATGNNPLHVVNAQRQKGILDAMKSKDWTAQNSWEAKQTPKWFETDANGNSQYNKNYYANLLESNSRAMREAETSGDTFAMQEWERALRENLEKYKSAPGAEQYMVGINNNEAWAKQWGVNQVGSDWFNSEWNNPEVRSQGYAGQRYWTENPVFEDFNLLSQTLNLSNQYGGEEEQKQRQAINNQAMQAYYAGDIQSQMQSEFDARLQAELDAQKKAYEDLLAQLQAQQQQNDYIKDEIGNAGGGGGSVVTPPANIDSIFTPGSSSNTSGYVENQLVTNDLFNNYLKNIYQGGF